MISNVARFQGRQRYKNRNKEDKFIIAIAVLEKNTKKIFCSLDHVAIILSPTVTRKIRILLCYEKDIYKGKDIKGE